MEDEVIEPKQGFSNYIRPQVLEEIKKACANDKTLAIQVLAWLKTYNLQITKH